MNDTGYPVGHHEGAASMSPPTPYDADGEITADPCPRCGTEPIEARRLDEREPRHLPACACYPHPPLCVGCRSPLDADRCTQLGCHYLDILQPVPIIDPLYEVKEQ